MNNFEVAQKIQEREVQMKDIRDELAEKNFKDINFCKDFISKNEEYVGSNLKKVFTAQIAKE